jgi:hypothetical protein
LRTVNERRRKMGVATGGDIGPEECLVFEDSVPGAASGRRAGMRLVWCPHPGLLEEYRGREKQVLAGRTGEFVEVDRIPGGVGEVGELDDGWAEMVTTLEDFGLPTQLGTTDKELEDMTARTEGKRHSETGGSRFGREDIKAARVRRLKFNRRIILLRE